MAIDLKVYEAMLDRIDWFYEYTEDHSVWQKGNQAMQQMLRHSQESPEHAELYKRVSKLKRGTQ